MAAVGVIPARYGSTRFPGKALAALNGSPLIRHPYEQAKRSRRLERVLIATDDARIAEAASGFGAEAVMTSPSHRSGTERIAEVARGLDASVLVNIQADEPLIRPEQIDQVVEHLAAHPAVPMATLMTALTRPGEREDPNVVKVVVDQDGYALYFSRAPIPCSRAQSAPSPKHQEAGPLEQGKHIGVYGYQRDFLLRFASLSPTPLEQAEQLEQLRALEHGYKIAVLSTPFETIGVDTPEDLRRVEELLAAGARGPGDRPVRAA